jgi:hypothetical protein
MLSDEETATDIIYKKMVLVIFAFFDIWYAIDLIKNDL